jgi:hypothetical protein
LKGKRVYGSQQSLEGEKAGQFDVLAVVGTYPLRYEVRCSRCQCAFQERHDNLIRPGKVICKNTGCGVAVPLTAKSWRAEQKKEFSKLEEQYRKSVDELAKAKRENLRVLRDEEFQMSETLRAIKFMPSSEDAEAYTSAQVDIFLRETPEYWPIPENKDALVAFLRRQGVDYYVDASTLKAAYLRLKEFGLLQERPAPSPTTPEQEPVRRIASERPVNTKPLMMRGIEPGTGLPRDYSEREVALMQSDAYRRAFFTTDQGLSKRALNLIDVLQGSRL